MRAYVSNRLALSGLLALAACSQGSKALPEAEQQAQPLELSTAQPVAPRVTAPLPKPTSPGDLRLPDGHLNYDALRARHGAPNTNLKFNPRATNVVTMGNASAIDVEDDQLIFPGTATWVLGKVGGDILSCGHECGPEGFLRKVVSVARSADGKEIVVKTLPAGIPDLVTDGWIHFEAPGTEITPPGHPDREILHHPRDWWMTSNQSATGITWWGLNWTGAGLSGADFQAATALNYGFTFDLTENGGDIETLSFLNYTAADFAVSTATTETIQKTVNTNVVTNTYGPNCEDCCGFDCGYNCGGTWCTGCCTSLWGSYENNAPNGWTTTTTTTTTDYVCSYQLTPSPLGSPFLPFNSPSDLNLPPANEQGYPPQAPLAVPPACPANNTTVVTSLNSNGQYPAGTVNTSVTTLTQNTSTPDLNTAADTNPPTQNGSSPAPIEFLPCSPASTACPTKTTNTSPFSINLGGFEVYVKGVLTQSMSPTVTYNGQVDVQGTIYYNETAETGLTYTSAGGFATVSNSSHSFGPPTSQAEATVKQGKPSGQGGVDFAGQMVYELNMGLNTGSWTFPPVVRRLTGTVQADFYQALSIDGGQIANEVFNCSTNSNEQIQVTGGVYGQIVYGNLNQLVDESINANNYTVPVPNQQCPACQFDIECGSVGAGYTCKKGLNGPQCDGATGCFCQPDGTTCTEGSCSSANDCAEVEQGHVAVPCVAVPLSSGVQNCCDGLNTQGNSCANGSCTSSADCANGGVCNGGCCQEATCLNGTGPNCPTGYSSTCTTNGVSGPCPGNCCEPTTCSNGACGDCPPGFSCNFQDPEFCCQVSSCTYAVCSQTSDCSVPNGQGGTRQLPMTCEGGCCIPTTACPEIKGQLLTCVNVPKGAQDNSVCGTNPSEFNCSDNPSDDSANSPWCCACNSGTACNNGSCPGGSYCDSAGCCYSCGSSGKETNSQGTTCATNTGGASPYASGTCPVVHPPDAGTNVYCQ